MPLTAGTKLGSYEILGSLGAGGMGEVYRARDSKLGRDVAIKVLPERLSQDPAALARFEREARAVAALSHPNILAIHDFGTESGVTYAVTELLEGSTLRVRMGDGALPVRKAIDFAVHVVRGIAAAHERGIVHRDLKPENIFITNDGVVKLLDFGLAKSAGPDGGRGFSPGESDGATAAQTQLAADTTPGTVLGTVGYMSPEQVRGLATDHRTDIFSFGAVFYEMLTGRRPFRGDSHVETMNAILKEDPAEFTDVTANVPGSVERTIRRCLEKQPSDRFHSAHDLAISLEALSGSSNSSAVSEGRGLQSALEGARGLQTPGIGRSGFRLSPLLAIAALVVVAAAGLWAGRAIWAPPPSTVTEFQRLTYRRGPIFSAAMAPDGATFYYSARWEGTPLQIYSTRAESPESLALPYLNANVASISTKGELALIRDRVNITGYANIGTLARAPVSGGAGRDVLEGVQHADWLPDGSDLAVSHVVDGKYRVEFPIGKVVYETTGWVSHVSVSPDGTRVAILDQPNVGDDRGGVSIIDGSGARKQIPVECESAQGIAWTASGHEVWFTCASKGLWRSLLAATPEGVVRTVLRVPGTMILGDIGADGTVLLTHDSSRRGVIALAPGDTKERDVSWLDWTQPMALSDDGRTLVIGEEGEGGGPGYATFLRKTDGSPAIRLGAGEGLALSADGRWVIAQKQDPPSQLVLMPTGAGAARALTKDDITHTDARFLPDGKRFVFIGFKPGRPPRTWVQPLEGGEPTPVTPEGTTGVLVTPDGTQLVVRATDGSRSLMPFPPSTGAAVPLKGLEPPDNIIRFTPDGRSLLLRRRKVPNDGSQQIFRLDLASGARTLVRLIAPLPESVANGGVGQVLMTADASAYVYGYGVTHSDLFLVKGLK